jgi:proteasome lid subunit RPN8/RPN11
MKKVIWNPKNEIGGVLLGTSHGKSGCTITRILQFKNESKEPNTYKLPHYFIVALKIWWACQKGERLIGEWHSHLNGSLKLSQEDADMGQAKANVAEGGEYRIGIIGGQGVKKGRMKIYKFFKKEK